MRRTLLISSVIFLMTFGIFLNNTAAQTKISLASTLPNTGLNKVVVDTFIAEMKKAVPDLTIDLFMDGKLGGEKELLEMLKLGETQIQIGTLHSTVYFPELDATSVPYLFPDYAAIKVFLSGPIGEKMDQALLQKGNGVFMGVFDMGSRWTTSNKKFETLEELKGIKIRIAEIPLWIKVWSGMGATITPMPAPDVYSALKTGVIDAQDNMLSNILGRKIYEAQKFLINTQHIQAYNTIMVQRAFWNKLTPERKKAFQSAIAIATKAGDEQTKAENEKIVKQLQGYGLTLVQPKPEFRIKALPIVGKVAKEILSPGVYEEALKAVAKR